MYSQILEQLKECTAKNIVFYGASLFLKDFLKNNNLCKYNIKGIIDADENKWGNTFSGYQIFSLDKLKELQPVDVIFTIENSHKVIYESLKTKFENDSDLKYVNLYSDVFSISKKDMYRIAYNRVIKEIAESKKNLNLGFEF